MTAAKAGFSPTAGTPRSWFMPAAHRASAPIVCETGVGRCTMYRTSQSVQSGVVEHSAAAALPRRLRYLLDESAMFVDQNVHVQS